MNFKEISAHETCCQCGMEKSHWSAPGGVKRQGAVFCCQRCADETGCRCEESLRKARFGKHAGRPARARFEWRAPARV